MKVRLKDISDETGFSISTVSRVLRGDAKKNTKRVKQILKSAQKLGYPIHAQENSSPKKDVYIAIITNFNVGDFYAAFFKGFYTASVGTNFKFSLFHSEYDNESIIELISKLSVSSGLYSGFVLFMPSLKENDYKEILSETPKDTIILSAAPLVYPVFDTLTFDSYSGAFAVANHFHNRGYKELGLVMGPLHRYDALLRKNGFIDYIEHHSDMSLSWQMSGNYTLESGWEAYTEFKKLEKKPRAIFFSNDDMCLGFMEKARDDNYSFPEDIAIAGYDDLPICSYHHPSVSSVHTDYTMLGKNAINYFIERIERNNPQPSGLLSMVPVSLCIRDSS